MNPPRPVLDTNVVLSALLFSSSALAWLRRAWQADMIRPLASRETTMELIRVLGYPKFRLTAGEREDLLADFLPFCETAAVPDGIEVPVCRGPPDRPFLKLAVAGKADWLVTGDNDLLVLAPDFSVPIVTPAALRELPDASLTIDSPS